MVDRTRELELSLGSGEKRVAANELETVVMQRRCLRTARPVSAGEVLRREDIEPLRPAPAGSIPPYELDQVVGTRALVDLPTGEMLTWRLLGC
jgi:N-acetylneuraminate synthase